VVWQAYLQDKPRFEAIVRPKGTSLEQVTLTWKYRDGMYAHYPVVESDKDEAKPMLLGNTLSIYQRQFEDLDEIFATYVGCVAVGVECMPSHWRLSQFHRPDVTIRA